MSNTTSYKTYSIGRTYRRDKNGVLLRGRNGKIKTRLFVYSTKNYAESTGVGGFGVLQVIFVILLLSALFSSLSGSPTSFTFSGLLEKLSTCPSLYGDWMTTLTDARIYNDWGQAFNWFRDFLNMFMNILSVGVYMCTGIVQLLLYAIFMLSVVFGG